MQEKQEDVIIDKKRKYYPIFTFMKQGTTGTGSGPTQRVFTGTVTKFHENFGFVDEDVFFQTSVVKGQTPRVNVCTKYSKEMRFECYNVAILPQKLFLFYFNLFI